MFAALAQLLRRLCQERLVDLRPETRLDEVAGLDSLRLIEAVAQLEERFGVVIDTDNLAELRMVGDIARLILDAGPQADLGQTNGR